MASIFTMIINGDIPGHFIYRDDACVAFLSIEPLTKGHTLIVPIEEVDHWIDLDPDLAAHLMQVAQKVGQAIDAVYSPRRVGLMIVGDEVPHVHIHVAPIDSARDLDFANAASATSEELAVVADRLRNVLG
jgi:diadenosine tetraphosphate (Ap4A) HIT family hydrolase